MDLTSGYFSLRFGTAQGAGIQSPLDADVPTMLRSSDGTVILNK